MSTLIVDKIRGVSNVGSIDNLEFQADSSGNVTIGGQVSVGTSNPSIITNTTAALGTITCPRVIATETSLAPFTVSSGVKVTDLNADKLDGFDTGGSTDNIPVLKAPSSATLAPDAGKLSTEIMGRAIPAGELVGTSDTQTLSAKSFTGNVAITGGVLSVSGNNAAITCTGDITAFATSDERLKENIKILSDDPVEDIHSIRGVRFDWKDNLADGLTSPKTGPDVGVIAQEVEKVLPEAVIERSDGTLAVKYESLIPLLIEAVKEISTYVDELHDDIDELNEKIYELTNQSEITIGENT